MEQENVHKTRKNKFIESKHQQKNHSTQNSVRLNSMRTQKEESVSNKNSIKKKIQTTKNNSVNYNNENNNSNYVKFGNKVIKEKVIKYCLLPSTKRDPETLKPSKKFNQFFKLTTNELKSKQIGEFGNIKNFKTEQIFTEPNSNSKGFSKKKETFNTVKDLACIFFDEKNLMINLINKTLHKLSVQSIFIVRF